MMKKLLAGLASLMLLLSLNVSAEQPVDASDPYSLISTVATNTVNRLKSMDEKDSHNPQKMRQVVDEELLPYINYTYASYTVLGPELSKTSKAQRDAFTDAFKDYLVATMAQVFTKYNPSTQNITLRKPGDITGRRIVSVRAEFNEGDKPPVNVDFKARLNKKTAQWQVIDFVAEGISMLSSKQSELGGLIRQKGIDAVTAELKQKVKNGISLDDEIPAAGKK